MSDEVMVQPENEKGLSQVERVVDTFMAPTKTFTDILRDASWWMPFVLSLAIGVVLTVAVVTKVGWEQLVANQVQSSPTLQSKMAPLTPEALTAVHKQMIMSFKVGLLGGPAFALLIVLLVAVVLWPTINFVFGGKAEFKRVFCMVNYAYLPLTIKSLVAALTLYLGVAADNFTLDNMLGTSVGYYYSTPGVLKSFLTSFDVFTIWVLILMSIGLAIVAKTKKSAGFISVVGWWIVTVILTTASKAVFG